MIFFIFGKDSYRSKERLRGLLEEYGEKYKKGLGLRVLDLESQGTQDLRNELQTVSMFEDKKMILVKNLFEKEGQEEEIKDVLKNKKESRDLILIWENKDIKKTSLLYKFLKKEAELEEFDFLEEKELISFVRKEFKKYGKEAPLNVIDKLVEFIGNDAWLLSQEIKKISSFKKSGDIEEKDVLLLVKPKIESDIFKTIDAIAQKNKSLALNLIHKHLEKGDNALYLLSMIAFQFRNLLLVKDLVERGQPPYAIPKISGIHPFVARKSLEQAQKFTLLELKRIYQKILQADLFAKTGKISPEVSLDFLIFEI